jgi:hypothetical protein
VEIVYPRGCAICDPVIAVWCFADGPSIKDVSRRWSPLGSPHQPGDGNHDRHDRLEAPQVSASGRCTRPAESPTCPHKADE